MTLMMTPYYAAALAVFYVLLAVLVIRQRFKNRVGLGDGQKPGLVTAIRVHGNFAEYVPLLLVLMLLLELQQAPLWQLHLIGCLTIGGRILHAIGLNKTQGTSAPRFIGMVSTFVALLASAVFFSALTMATEISALAKEPEQRLKVTGQGEAILLLHSSLSSHKQWLPLAALLAERYSLWLPDLQGYGRNSPVAFSQNPVWSLADEADALLATLTPEQKNTPLILIAHSFGGALALHLARTGKLKVKALLLFEPVAFHLLAAESDAQAVALTAEVRVLSEQMPALEAAAAAQLFVDYWQQADYFRHLPARMQQQMAAQVWKVPQDFSALINEAATTADYAALHMPVLLLCGSESRQSALRVSQLLAKCWPHAQITRLPTGHMGPVTASELVNQHIVAFLAGLPHKAEPGI